MSSETEFTNQISSPKEPLFTGADEAECARRDAERAKIELREWKEDFFKRKDIKKLKDGSYDVDGDVELDAMSFYRLPLRFNHVSGEFLCYDSELTTLEGCPKTVGANFACNDNLLTSLEFMPKIIHGNCKINGNLFTDLKHCTEQIDGDFIVSTIENDYLISLEGCPKHVGGSFRCEYTTNLSSFKGGPETVGGDFLCSDNRKIASLEGIPKMVGGLFNVIRCGRPFKFEEFENLVSGPLYCNLVEGYRQRPTVPEWQDKLDSLMTGRAVLQ